MFRGLKKYTPFLRVNIMTMFTYRASIVSWFFVELFYFMMMIYLWLAIYSNRTTLNGYNKDEILMYFLIIGLIGVFTQVEAMFTVSGELRQGQISMYLIKPINYKIRIFFEEIGRRLGISLVIVPINILIIFLLMTLMGIQFSFGLMNILMFIIYIPIIFLFMFEFFYLFGLLSIYTTNVFGLAILANIIVQISSGGLVPLNFYPEAIRNIVSHLPFQYIYYYPSSILLGKFSMNDALVGMLFLIIWVLFFKLLNFLLFKVNVKKIVIFGG